MEFDESGKEYGTTVKQFKNWLWDDEINAVNYIDYKRLTTKEITDVANISMKQTALRSIYTSLTTIIPVITLIILGSREVLSFNLAMTVGLIAGTYSSLFIAPLLWTKFAKLGYNKKQKIYSEKTEKTITGIND